MKCWSPVKSDEILVSWRAQDVKREWCTSASCLRRWRAQDVKREYCTSASCLRRCLTLPACATLASWRAHSLRRPKKRFSRARTIGRPARAVQHAPAQRPIEGLAREGRRIHQGKKTRHLQLRSQLIYGTSGRCLFTVRAKKSFGPFCGSELLLRCQAMSCQMGLF